MKQDFIIALQFCENWYEYKSIISLIPRVNWLSSFSIGRLPLRKAD
jgi:hypothetical protein